MGSGKSWLDMMKVNHNVYLWIHANLQDMSEDILNFSLDFTNTHTIETTIEEFWSKLRNKLLDAMNTYVPSKIKSGSIRQPWINRTLKQLRRRKQQSYNKSRSTNLPEHWLHYKQLKKEMQKECCKSYNEYMSNIIHESYENGKKKKLQLQLYKISSPSLIFVVLIHYKRMVFFILMIKTKPMY